MKLEIIPQSSSMIKRYPYLGDANGLIVLFLSPKKGVVVKNHETNLNHRIGEYSDGWNEFFFKPLQGQLVLSND